MSQPGGDPGFPTYVQKQPKVQSFEDVENVDDIELTLPQYQFWLDAIKNEDSRNVCLILESSDAQTRLKLLRGKFRFIPSANSAIINVKRHSIVRPFSLAVTHGSLGVCDVMLQYGVDVFLQETNDYNVFHCLVCVAFYQPKNEQAVIRTYERLCELLPEESVAKLLRMEEELGLRPMEFAVYLGTLQFMTAIWETRPVYLVRQDIVGVHQYKWYDITEYMTTGSDTGRSYLKCPLQLFAYLDRRSFSSETGRQVLNESIIADWIARSVESKRQTFLIWLFMKIVYTCTFSIYQVTLSGTLAPYRSELDDSTSNFSESAVVCEGYSSLSLSGGLKIFLEAYLIVHSAVIVLYYIASIVITSKDRKLLFALAKDLHGKCKESVFDLSSFAQIYMSFVYAVMVFTEIVILDNPTRQNALFLTIYHAMQTPIILSTLLQCLAVSSTIGHVVVYIDRMMVTISLFSATFTAYLVCFGRLFILLSRRSYDQCVDEFSGFASSAYTTILIFFNVPDLRQLEIDAHLGIYCAHVAYVFVVAILFFNLLIAFLSDDVRQVYENKSVVVSMNQIYAVGEIDFIFRKVPGVSKFYHYLNETRIRGSFVHIADRAYLVARQSARQLPHVRLAAV